MSRGLGDVYKRQGCRLYRTRRGRWLHHPQLPDPAPAREHRILLLYKQAGEFRHVQGRRRSGPTEPEINQNTPQRRERTLSPRGVFIGYDDCAYLFYM